jgi:signal transduction histidine kinase
MAVSSTIVAGVAISVLYRTSIKEQHARLVETAQSQARLIEAVARFDKKYIKDYPAGPENATLSKIIDAHEHYAGFGKTGEFTLSRKKGDDIVFLLSHRHFDLDQPRPVPFHSELAEPMRRALLGRSGTVTGYDYRGEVVMAAHEPVAELDLGIVAKIDMSEIRQPFLKAGAIAGLFTVLVVLAGVSLFIKITNPMIRQLETRTVELQTMTDGMSREITDRKRIQEALSWEADINNALSELSRTLISTSSIEDISAQVLETSKKLTDSALGYAGYIDPETGYLISPTMTRDIWEICQVKEKSNIFKTYHGLCGWVLKNRRAILTNSASKDTRSTGIPEGHMPIHRFLSAPATIGNDTVGQISLANPNRDYRRRDLRLINRIAAIYAITIHRKRAEDALQKAHDNLEKRVEERTSDLKKSNVNLKQEIAERMRMEKALRKSEKQLRALAARIQEVQETERKNLSQELHDRVGQSLSALNLNLNIITSQLSKESNTKIGDRLQDSMSLVEETTVHIRDVMAELRPPVLDDYGLLAALRWHCERFSDRTEIDVEVRGEEPSPRLSLIIESIFFRIAQEALNNISKHAEANLATVMLEGADDHLRMIVEDNGRGFDFAALHRSKEQPGWGFTTMKERAAALGGSVRIESKTGKGTRVITEFRR